MLRGTTRERDEAARRLADHPAVAGVWGYAAAKRGGGARRLKAARNVAIRALVVEADQVADAWGDVLPQDHPARIRRDATESNNPWARTLAEAAREVVFGNVLLWFLLWEEEENKEYSNLDGEGTTGLAEG